MSFSTNDEIEYRPEGLKSPNTPIYVAIFSRYGMSYDVFKFNSIITVTLPLIIQMYLAYFTLNL